MMKLKKSLVGAAVLSGVLLPTAAFAQTARICFEAEKFNSVQSPLRKLTPGANKQYSGAGFLDIPWDKNQSKGIGAATYRINVKTPGTYYLWARTFWANGCGNSIGMTVNGGSQIVLGEDGTYDKWHWVGGNARVQLKSGVNTFVIRNRETGVRVDQVFLTQDRGYTPTGIRKATH